MLRLPLFRAVRPAEAASLRRLARFTNIAGVECKYFTEGLIDARLYASMAQARFRDGPYVIVGTAIDADLLAPGCRIVVDGGIAAVVIESDLLPALQRPLFVEE